MTVRCPLCNQPFSEKGLAIHKGMMHGPPVRIVYQLPLDDTFRTGDVLVIDRIETVLEGARRKMTVSFRRAE